MIPLGYEICGLTKETSSSPDLRDGHCECGSKSRRVGALHSGASERSRLSRFVRSNIASVSDLDLLLMSGNSDISPLKVLMSIRWTVAKRAQPRLEGISYRTGGNVGSRTPHPLQHHRRGDGRGGGQTLGGGS